MRYLLPALVLLVIIAGASTLIPLEFRPPASRGGYPPAPTALEESGMAETGAAHVVPASPPVHRQVPPADRAVTRSRSPRVSRPAQPTPGPQTGTEPIVGPPAQIRDAMRPVTGPHGIRDTEAGAEPASTDERQGGGELAGQPAPQVENVVRAPVVSPPVLLTPVAGYPTEGYRIALDRTMLTPRLRVEAAQGRVMLKVLVRADGSVGSVEVTESSGIPALDQAAVRQAGAWVFAPATRGSQPIEAWALISVWFVVP